MRPQLVFDGKGINGPDEYRTRVATFQTDKDATTYGPLFATSTEMLDALKACIEALEFIPCKARHKAEDAVKRAEGK